MSYASCATGRGDLRTGAFNDSMYAYHTFLPAQLRASTTCFGAGPAPGMVCAQNNRRATIAGEELYLHGRSCYSSGGPVTPETAYFPDTLSLPLQLTEAQQRILNKGDSLMSYDTRQFDGAQALNESTGVFQRQMQANTWRETFAFRPFPGTNLNTRIMALDAASAQEEVLRGQLPSYGVYGVMKAC